MASYTLRTGLVIAGGYADKVRRTLFAQLREEVKRGTVSNSEVARAAAELNRLLYVILVEKLGIDKGDVVRITVDYEVEPPNIKWSVETLQVQAWKRLPDDEVQGKVKESLPKAEEVMKGAIELKARKLGETETGDLIYELLYNDVRVGALLVTPLDGGAIVRGAITDPTPIILRRTRVDFEGDLDSYIEGSASSLIEKGVNSEYREAQRVVQEIMAVLSAGKEALEEEYGEE